MTLHEEATSATPDPVGDDDVVRAEGWWPWIVLGLLLFGVTFSSWRPVPAGVWHDDGAYMLIGKAIADGHGFSYHGVVGSPPATKFPPLFPLTLAAVWTVFRSIGAATFAATFLNIGLLASAGALFGRLLHRQLGLPLVLSAGTAAIGFASTDVVRTALVPLSEPLFLLLTMATLALWPRVARVVDGAPAGAGPSTLRSGLLAPALMLLLLVATRSAGLALVLSFAFATVVTGRSRPAAHDTSGAPRAKLARRVAVGAAVSAPALLFVVGWGRWAESATSRIPEGARDLLGPYQGWLSDQLLSAPGTFFADLPSHAVGVFGRAAALLLPGLSGTPMWLVALLLLPLLVLGTRGLVERCPPLGWFVLAYLAMLLLWPYLDRRLLTPLHPVLVAALAVGGSELMRRLRGQAARNALVAAGLLWTVAYSSLTAYRVADGWPTAPYRVRADNLAAAVEALQRTVPPVGSVVGAPEFWAALHLHGGWTVSPSVRFDPRSVDPAAPMWGTPDEQLALWRASGIDHLLLEQSGQLHGAALDQLEAACPGSVFVLAQMPTALVVKLEWEASCPPAPPSTPRSPGRNTPD